MSQNSVRRALMMPRATSSCARLELQHAPQRPAQLKPPFGSGSGPPHWRLRTRRVSMCRCTTTARFCFCVPLPMPGLRHPCYRSPALMPHGIHLRLSIRRFHLLPLPPAARAVATLRGQDVLLLLFLQTPLAVLNVFACVPAAMRQRHRRGWHKNMSVCVCACGDVCIAH